MTLVRTAMFGPVLDQAREWLEALALAGPGWAGDGWSWLAVAALAMTLADSGWRWLAPAGRVVLRSCTFDAAEILNMSAQVQKFQQRQH